MDRIVLRVPAARSAAAAPPPTASSKIQMIIAATMMALFAVFVARNNSDEKNNAQTITTTTSILAAIILIGAFFYQRAFASRRFAEAAIEISPIGVQLVSVYGNDTKNKIRAFLPRQQILDVIVMEVVWPHCVWSQVAFRVLKRGGIDIDNIDMNMNMSGLSSRKIIAPAHGETPKKCNHEEHDNNNEATTTSQNQNAQQKINQTKNAPPSMQQLLKQNRVSIVPAFPEECRGMLSYEQCLHVQGEIEKLLQ